MRVSLYSASVNNLNFVPIISKSMQELMKKVQEVAFSVFSVVRSIALRVYSHMPLSTLKGMEIVVAATSAAAQKAANNGMQERFGGVKLSDDLRIESKFTEVSDNIREKQELEGGALPSNTTVSMDDKTVENKDETEVSDNSGEKPKSSTENIPPQFIPIVEENNLKDVDIASEKSNIKDSETKKQELGKEREALPSNTAVSTDDKTIENKDETEVSDNSEKKQELEEASNATVSTDGEFVEDEVEIEDEIEEDQPISLLHGLALMGRGTKRIWNFMMHSPKTAEDRKRISDGIHIIYEDVIEPIVPKTIFDIAHGVELMGEGTKKIADFVIHSPEMEENRKKIFEGRDVIHKAMADVAGSIADIMGPVLYKSAFEAKQLKEEDLDELIEDVEEVNRR